MNWGQLVWAPWTEWDDLFNFSYEINDILLWNKNMYYPDYRVTMVHIEIAAKGKEIENHI